MAISLVKRMTTFCGPDWSSSPGSDRACCAHTVLAPCALKERTQPVTRLPSRPRLIDVMHRTSKFLLQNLICKRRGHLNLLPSWQVWRLPSNASKTHRIPRMNPFTDINVDVLLYICSYLDATSLLHLSKVRLASISGQRSIVFIDSPTV